MSNKLFSFPEPKAVVHNGESFVEFVHDGKVVGEFNISKVLKNWWESYKTKKDQAKVVSR